MRVLNATELGKRNNMMNGMFKNKVVAINCSKKQALYICLNVERQQCKKKFIQIALKCRHTGI